MRAVAYVKHLKLWVQVQRINLDVKTIECYLTDASEGDMSEYGFNEIKDLTIVMKDAYLKLDNLK